MSRFLITASLAACLLSTIAFSGLASAQVIYSDTFARTTGSGDGNGDPNGAADNVSDWGTNDNSLGGTVAQGWVTGPTRAGGGRNAVTDGDLGISHGTTSLFTYDITSDALAADGFTIGLDFNRFLVAPDPGPGGGGYITFGLGVDSGLDASGLNDFIAVGASDFAVLFQQATNASTGTAGNANVILDGQSGTADLIGRFDYGDPDVEHSLLLTVVPQNSGAYGDSDTIDISVSVDGSVLGNYAVTGGDDFGTFAISANNNAARYIDNLVVTGTAAIPEPSSLALLGLGGLALIGRRRR